VSSILLFALINLLLDSSIQSHLILSIFILLLFSHSSTFFILSILFDSIFSLSLHLIPLFTLSLFSYFFHMIHEVNLSFFYAHFLLIILFKYLRFIFTILVFEQLVITDVFLLYFIFNVFDTIKVNPNYILNLNYFSFDSFFFY
jgi:hypothetical protein